MPDPIPGTIENPVSNPRFLTVGELALLFHRQTVTLSNDQIQRLPLAPLTLIPAPAENASNIVTIVLISKNFVAPYSNVSQSLVLRVGYNNALSDNDLISLLNDVDVEFFGSPGNALYQVSIFPFEYRTGMLGSPVKLAIQDAGGLLTGGDPSNSMSVTLVYLTM